MSKNNVRSVNLKGISAIATEAPQKKSGRSLCYEARFVVNGLIVGMLGRDYRLRLPKESVVSGVRTFLSENRNDSDFARMLSILDFAEENWELYDRAHRMREDDPQKSAALYTSCNEACNARLPFELDFLRQFAEDNSLRWPQTPEQRAEAGVPERESVRDEGSVTAPPRVTKRK